MGSGIGVGDLGIRGVARRPGRAQFGALLWTQLLRKRVSNLIESERNAVKC